MKRRIVYFATATVLLCGCAREIKTETTDAEGFETEETETDTDVQDGENNDTEESKGTSIDPGDWKKQIVFLQCCSKQWELETEIRDGHDYYEAECNDHGYAIADLDEDGFLEVIKSFYMGNAHSSINRIFEVTMDGNLVEWGEDIYEEPDLLMQDTLTLYENENGERFYIAYDFESYGVQGQKDSYIQMFVKANAITYREICSCERLLGEKEENNAYYHNQPITYDEYMEMIKWDQFREIQTIELNWVKDPEEITYE